MKPQNGINKDVWCQTIVTTVLGVCATYWTHITAVCVLMVALTRLRLPTHPRPCIHVENEEMAAVLCVDCYAAVICVDGAHAASTNDALSSNAAKLMHPP